MNMNDEQKLEQYVNEVEGNKNHEATVHKVGAQDKFEPAPKIEDITTTSKTFTDHYKIGYHNLNIEELPSKGKFYKEGTRISIKSATVKEIKHWSTINEDDVINSVDNILNYIIEKCCNIVIPGISNASYLDILEVDRFYIILAIRELTFVDGAEKLTIKTDSGDIIPITKEMIDFINIDPRLMKHYNDTERRFIIDGGNEKIEFSLPTIGITNFMKNYVIKANQNGNFDKIDMDYLAYAPFLLHNWRELTDNKYYEYEDESNFWSIEKLSVIVELKDMFQDSIEVKVKYIDGGKEVFAPLNFWFEGAAKPSSIKNIFLFQNRSKFTL